MKKLLALFGSVLLFTGLKAQKDIIVKKETTAAVKLLAADSLKNTPANKQNSPVSSIYIKKSNTVVLKKSNTVVLKEKVVLPVKGIIIPEVDKPIKNNSIIKPIKQ